MKIGLGVITHKRKEYFSQIASKIPHHKIQELVVVNDGTPYNINILKDKTIQNKNVLGVSKSKNIALKNLLDKKCDYIFLMEDDIFIKKENVFNAYINLYKETGIHHFNFALHGKMNVLPDKTPAPRLTVNYNKLALNLYQHCVGAFSFYTKEVLEEVGLIDEDFHNAFDHVEHTYRIIQARKHPPFWWFADLSDSFNYLSDIEWSPKTSTIHTKTNFSENFKNSLLLFNKKHNIEIQQIPSINKELLCKNLKEIHHNSITKNQL